VRSTRQERPLDPPVEDALWLAEVVASDAAFYVAPVEAARRARGRVPLAEAPGQCSLLRDVAGNPFRPVRVERAWLAWNGGLPAAMAAAIYDECRFADLPVLADALEEAGCDDAELLSHLRSPGPHARGCWALDLLLGKE
jgi:hypothetical protein